MRYFHAVVGLHIHIRGPREISEAENFTIECEVSTTENDTISSSKSTQLGMYKVMPEGHQTIKLFSMATNSEKGISALYPWTELSASISDSGQYYCKADMFPRFPKSNKLNFAVHCNIDCLNFSFETLYHEYYFMCVKERSA